jgi:hypothetical protein
VRKRTGWNDALAARVYMPQTNAKIPRRAGFSRQTPGEARRYCGSEE